jgi:hypothetical protein
MTEKQNLESTPKIFDPDNQGSENLGEDETGESKEHPVSNSKKEKEKKVKAPEKVINGTPRFNKLNRK